MYFYDPYGPRPSGRYYRLEDDLEPVCADTMSPYTIFAPEIGNQVYEGFSPLDFISNNDGKRNIVLNGIPIERTQIGIPQVEPTQIQSSAMQIPDRSTQLMPIAPTENRLDLQKETPIERTQINIPQVEPTQIQSSAMQIPDRSTQLVPIAPTENRLVLQKETPIETKTAEPSFEKPQEEKMLISQVTSKPTVRVAITDQFSDTRINSMISDSSQTVDDGLEHPGYVASDDGLSYDAGSAIGNEEDRGISPTGAGSVIGNEEDHGSSPTAFYEQYGSAKMENEDNQPPIVMSGGSQTENTSEQQTSEQPKKSIIPLWMILSGIGLVLFFFSSAKKEDAE